MNNTAVNNVNRMNNTVVKNVNRMNNTVVKEQRSHDEDTNVSCEFSKGWFIHKKTEAKIS
jgi:hypothetical protein